MKRVNKEIKLTVFTPSFNRAHTLPRLYDSLREQTCKEFIWLVIDDGSEDNTRELVSSWMENEEEFEIRYYFKENGGMHTAHNAAYELIDTELNTCIDSDDMMPFNAVELILEKWKDVGDKGFAGIIGLDSDLDGKIIGKGFSEDLFETTLCGYYAAGGQGDKKLVYRTDVINQYPPYPVFEGEKYVALGCKYRLVDQDYKLAVLNEILVNVDYQPDGSSATMLKQYLNNPKGFAYWRTICMKYPESAKRLPIDCMHYVSSSLISGNRNYIKESPRKLMTLVMIPAGHLLTWYIKKKNQKASI